MKFQTARLDQLCEIFGGGTPSRQMASYFGHGTAWATPGDVTSLDSLYIAGTKEHVTDLGLRNSSAKRLPPGAVLLTSRATIGYTAVSRVPICTNQGFVNFICGPSLRPEFLAYWLRTQRSKMMQQAGGTTFKEISRGSLRKFEISYPSVAAQDNIIDLLTRAEGILRLRREAQRKAGELIPALFIDRFGDPASNPKGWPTSTLGSLLSACDYGTSRKSSVDGAGIPVLRMGNVNYSGDLDLADLKHVELDATELSRQALRPGDLLFNRTNSKELVGKTGLWDGRWPAVAASYFIRLRVRTDLVLPEYIWASMNSRHMKRVLFATARGAIGQANINTQELKALELMVPPLELQRRFVEEMTATRSIQATQDQGLRAAQATFDALLHRAFAP